MILNCISGILLKNNELHRIVVNKVREKLFLVHALFWKLAYTRVITFFSKMWCNSVWIGRELKSSLKKDSDRPTNKCEVLLHQYLQWQTQNRVVVQVSTLWKCGKNYKILSRASPWLGNITQTLHFLSLQILSWWWIKIIILVVNDRGFTLHKYLCIYTRLVGRGNYKGSLILSEYRNSDQICMWDRGGGPRGCKCPKQQSLLKS